MKMLNLRHFAIEVLGPIEEFFLNIFNLYVWTVAVFFFLFFNIHMEKVSYKLSPAGDKWDAVIV